MGDPEIFLRYLSEQAAQVIIVQVLAEDDRTPPKRGNYRLVDSETGESQEIYIDAVAEQQYKDAFSRHLEYWHSAARQVGAVMTTVIAEKIVENWLLDDLVASEILKIK
jgi:hypothetical protein